jgi:hypothetical protein
VAGESGKPFSTTSPIQRDRRANEGLERRFINFVTVMKINRAPGVSV